MSENYLANLHFYEIQVTLEIRQLKCLRKYLSSKTAESNRIVVPRRWFANLMDLDKAELLHHLESRGWSKQRIREQLGLGERRLRAVRALDGQPLRVKNLLREYKFQESHWRLLTSDPSSTPLETMIDAVVQGTTPSKKLRQRIREVLKARSSS